MVSIAAIFQLKHLNIDSQVKALLLQRHFAFVITFALLNSFILVTFVLLHRELDDKEAYKDSRILKFMQLMFYLQGFLMTCVRLFEPAFFKIVYRKMKRCLCRDSASTKLESQPSDNGFEILSVQDYNEEIL